MCFRPYQIKKNSRMIDPPLPTQDLAKVPKIQIIFRSQIAACFQKRRNLSSRKNSLDPKMKLTILRNATQKMFLKISVEPSSLIFNRKNKGWFCLRPNLSSRAINSITEQLKK